LVFIETFIGVGSRLDIKPEHLSKFIQREVEENLNLDYQEIPAHLNFDTLSKDVSAFANSAGGMLVLGVREKPGGVGKPGLPGAVTWGPPSITKEQVESNLLAKIHPWINGLIIHPVRNPESGTVFLFDIPQGITAHQAGDRKYYQRFNFQSVPMEHYQIVDLMNRRSSPILKPIIEVLKVASEGKSVTLHIGLVNEGNVIAKHPLLFIKSFKCGVVVEDAGFFGLRIQGEEIEDGEKVVVITSENPWAVIHPQMINYFGNCVLSLIDKGCSFEMMIGCEGALTERYWVLIGQKFLKGLTPGEERVRLSYWTMNQMTAEMFEAQMKQAGIGEAELNEAVKKRPASEQPQVVT